jgi:hypothetical protein
MREGRPAGVLALGWARPRLSIADRVHAAAQLFAAEVGEAMERTARVARESARRAIEINDNVVQGLVLAKYALSAGRETEGREAIDITLERARDIVTEQLEGVIRIGGELRPGDLQRDESGSVQALNGEAGAPGGSQAPGGEAGAPGGSQAPGPAAR